jgi:hypothetical protein
VPRDRFSGVARDAMVTDPEAANGADHVPARDARCARGHADSAVDYNPALIRSNLTFRFKS